MALQRSYTAGKFALELDGADVGFAVSVEGGEPFGEVVEAPPAGVRVDKHLGGVGYAPIVVEVGASMADAFLDWVDSTLQGSPTAKNGAISFLDYTLKERTRLEWTSGLITEVGFPALDASSKDAVVMRVTIQPERSTFKAGSGATHQPGTKAKSQAAMRSQQFRFAVSGLEQALRKVVRVDPIVVRRRTVDAGEMRPLQTYVLDVADVTFWMPATEVTPFTMWFDDFVIGGHNDTSKERTGTLRLFDASGQHELLGIELEGLGIVRISHEREESRAEVVALVKVEMYCDAVRLATPPAPPPSPPPSPPPAASGESAVESLASALVAALRSSTGPTPPTVEALAERLLASVEPRTDEDERQRGRSTGRKWASGLARLDELEAIASLAESPEWTAFALREDHSLVAFLAASGRLPADESGPLDLIRDEFTTGLVAGATEVYREIAPRLRERRSTDT